MEVNIHEAKNRLSHLIERALNGEEVVIAKAGKPLVCLTRIPERCGRVLGSAEGGIEFTEGWDQPLSDTEVEEFLAS